MSSTGESSRACSHPTLEPAEQPSETCKTPTQAASCHEDHVARNGSTKDWGRNHCWGNARQKRQRRRRELQQRRAMAKGAQGQRARAASSGAASVTGLLQGPQSPKAAVAVWQGAGSPHTHLTESLSYLPFFFLFSQFRKKEKGRETTLQFSTDPGLLVLMPRAGLNRIKTEQDSPTEPESSGNYIPLHTRFFLPPHDRREDPGLHLLPATHVPRQ